MENYVLEMRDITKTFPGVVALDHVSLKVKSGEVHAIVGENGAGKSTLMKILNGVYTANEGEILLDGNLLELDGVTDAQRKGISIIFQEFNLINTLSIAENIFLGRFNGKNRVNWKELRKNAKAILDTLNFPLDVDKTVSKLSTAEKQMVEIAKALSLNAKLIVMDEPTSSLTKSEVEILFSIISRLKQEGITIIYISHKLEEVFRICDTVTVLRDGKVIGVNPVASMTRDSVIEQMVGRTIETEFPKRDTLPGEVILELKDINQGDTLKGINLQLRKGEILGFAGLVGAGRTELAEVIFGAEKVDSGTITVNGKQAVIQSTTDGINNSIGLLTEERKETGLILDFSVVNNITITKLDAVTQGGLLNKKKERQVAAKYVDDLSIKTPSLAQNVINLSGGNQQKVVLAKWLFSDVDILILDEPTRGIDVGAKQEIYHLMNELVASGKSIIMISSELPEVLGMSDRILVMHNGTIKGELTAAEMTSENVMQLAVD